MAVGFGVDRSTVTWTMGQIRPLLAGRGCALGSGVRLRTLADVFAYQPSWVRRPRRGRVRREAIVSSKASQNTIKTR
jgi:hypothetical protein